VKLTMRQLFRLLPVVSLFMFFGCYKFVLKPATPIPAAAEWRQFGGNPARSGNPHLRLDLPLELAWTYEANAAIEPTLVLADSVLYLGSMDGYIYALDLAKGKKLGRKKVRMSATCAWQEHKLIVARRYGKETLFCHDLTTGKDRWVIDGGDIQSEPLLAGEWIYVAAQYKHVDRYHLATGDKSWTFSTTAQLHSSPALSQSMLVVGSDDGTIYALNAETGESRWTFKTDGSVYATPVICNSTVYIGSFDNYLYALDLATGALKWKFKTAASIYHACAVNETSVIVGSNDYSVYNLDAATGVLQWSFTANSLISTAPVLTQTHVFFGSIDKFFYGLNLTTGEPEWKFEAQGRIRTTPIIFGDYLFGASENNVVYAFIQSKTKNK